MIATYFSCWCAVDLELPFSQTTPPRLFEHGYNKGCYAPYKATHNHLLPEHDSLSGGHNTHQLVQVSPVPPPLLALAEIAAKLLCDHVRLLRQVTRPAGGSIVTMRGTSDLTPSRFCRKNASKAWSSWLAPTGASLTTSSDTAARSQCLLAVTLARATLL